MDWIVVNDVIPLLRETVVGDLGVLLDGKYDVISAPNIVLILLFGNGGNGIGNILYVLRYK